MAAISEAGEIVRLNPTAGFVIKVKVLGAKDYSSVGRKVFINVCHDQHVPKPEIDFDPETVFPLIIDNKWEIPLIVSELKNVTDKKGSTSWAIDCCINPACFQWCQVSEDLKTILVEWCIEAVETAFELTLDREYTFPKMLAKGAISKTEIQKSELEESSFSKRLQELKNNEILGLLEEANDDSEEELPALTGINQDRSLSTKPLIEEIDTITTPMARKAPSKTKVQNQPLIKEVTPQKIEFTVVVNKSAYIIQFKAEQIKDGSSITLQIDPKSGQLILNNLNKSLYFTKADGITSNQLKIPIPSNRTVQTKEINSFYVKSDNSLYVFL